MMEKLRESRLSKGKVDGVTVKEDEVCEDEGFNRTLVGKIWTDSPYNPRDFKNMILQAWHLKNPVEIQDLNKNLYLFRFSRKKEADGILRSGPWSFDRNLLILEKITGNEQPPELEMSSMAFWVRIYDLPLKLRSEALAKKLGDLIGKLEEMD